MERHDSPATLEAVAIGLRRHGRGASVFDDEAAGTFLDILEEKGFAVVERGRTIMEWSPWRLKSVVPGRVHVRPGQTMDHQIVAEATATLVCHPPLGQGAAIEREITVSTSWGCEEDAVGSATRSAVALAMQQARDAAEGFISAASEDRQETA